MSSEYYSSYRRNAVSLWSVIFRLEGNIMFAVLPLCILNCLLLALVGYFREKYKFALDPEGHGFLTLLVSFLVISKVNLAYDRYKAVRRYAGLGSTALRELIQMAIAVTNRAADNEDNIDSDHAIEREKELRHWRLECVEKVTDILDASVCVLQDRSLANHFAYNRALKTPPVTNNSKIKHGVSDSEAFVDEETFVSDPLTLIQSMRLHIYCTPGLGFELLERVHLVNKLQEYTSCYTHLLGMASTPLPFPLVQMGRAFLLIWTFSMPLVLLDGPFTDMWGAMAFLFFLTYGFIGLELVSIKLSDPFGKSRDDIPISGLRDAAILGIEKDMKEVTSMQATISERRQRFSQQKMKAKNQPRPHSQLLSGATTEDHGEYNPSGIYHAMDSAHI